MYKYKVGKMIQQVKVPDVKPDNLSSMPGTYKGERESTPIRYHLISKQMLWQCALLLQK